jgi:TolA-binding protein
MSEYNDRYPKGALTEEARVILIEALLERGRTAEALVVLHDIQPQNAARGRDLTALRGELLGRAGRCSEALADFVMVLRVEVGDPAEERAIVGRATCRASAGDFAGTDDDLASYLVRFPNGRFAGSVRRTLHR